MRQSNDPGRARRVRTVFLSDIHLGVRHSRVRELCECLRRIDAERIVLVGDTARGQRLLKRPYWPLAERIELNIAASVRYINSFEHIVAGHARSEGYEGVVCGPCCCATQ